MVGRLSSSASHRRCPGKGGTGDPTSRTSFGLFCSVTMMLMASLFLWSPDLKAQTLSISSLGASSGLYSDDTRTAAGVTLNGEVSSYQPYFSYPGAPLPSATDDSLIALQIKFGNFYAGSDNNNGVLQLDGTTANSGKSSVKFYTGGEIAAGSALATFNSTFRWYMEPYTTTRTPALSLVVVGSNSLVYSLAFVGSGAVANDWNTFSVDATTSNWFIYGNGAPGGTVGKTLSAWLEDTTYGAILSGGSIVAQGFNIGSSQRFCRIGIDWLESSILNNGNRIDFTTPPNIWYVNDNSTVGDVYTTAVGDNANNGSASAPFATIAYAVSQAGAGDIIKVDAGSYTGDVSIAKSLSILGANAGLTGYNPSRGAESQILNSKITISGTTNVTVNGLQIYTTVNSPVDLILINSTTSTATIINNRIERFGTTAGVIARGLVTALGITTPVVIEDNFFTGDPSGGLFSGHTDFEQRYLLQWRKQYPHQRQQV
jgi:hypothetical protein